MDASFQFESVKKMTETFIWNATEQVTYKYWDNSFKFLRTLI